MQKGNIGITTENIFPVIKKFLYSDHEIFLRELVSNAVDATQKLKTLASKGEFKGELGELTVRVAVDKEQSTITISDHGIGMTAEEIDKYINQIAFSGANEFLEKYKDDANAIIGHFGLGFYSAFMVADKVDIITRSYREGAEAVKWTCDGSPAYEIDAAERAERGTDIVLHVSEDCKEFLEEHKVSGLLTKYCRFLPVAIAFGKKKEWKDGKNVETDEDNIINNTEPLWTKKPQDLTDEDYSKFYSELYPMTDEALFHIHLNVDFPFHLTGVLYFPKIKNNLELQRNKIQLYCNQVYVTDQVENIVPEFLTLLHGVIDSPDIPLNVSRSYLQSDANVKKISSYITKKVCDRLQSIFKNDRKEFENKWDDLKLFIHYGLLSDPSFYEKASAFALLKDVDGKFFTYKEYAGLIKPAQTDKDGNVVYLYASDEQAQYTYIESAKSRGYSVLLMDGQLDSHLVGMLEQKFEKSRFVRVDADTIDKLIQKENDKKSDLTENETERLSGVFSAVLPKLDKTEFHVDVAALGADNLPVIITQSEYMRRMKEMSQIQAGMSFYGEMPAMYSITLNSDHRLVKQVLSSVEEQCGGKYDAVDAELRGLNARKAAIEGSKKEGEDKESEEQLKDVREKISAQESEKKNISAAFAKDCAVIPQIIDLALLQSGLLRGEALSKFLKRTADLIGIDN